MTRGHEKRSGHQDPLESRSRSTAQTFKSCGWPPPPGADPDGYTEIRQESLSRERDMMEADNPVEDVWRSACRAYEVHYLSVQTGANLPFTVRVKVTERRYISGRRATPVAYLANVGPDEAAVRRSGHEVATGVRCLIR
jgi:hypothetical protein